MKRRVARVADKAVARDQRARGVRSDWPTPCELCDRLGGSIIRAPAPEQQTSNPLMKRRSAKGGEGATVQPSDKDDRLDGQVDEGRARRGSSLNGPLHAGASRLLRRARPPSTSSLQKAGTEIVRAVHGARRRMTARSPHAPSASSLIHSRSDEAARAMRGNRLKATSSSASTERIRSACATVY